MMDSFESPQGVDWLFQLYILGGQGQELLGWREWRFDIDGWAHYAMRYPESNTRIRKLQSSCPSMPRRFW